MRIRTILGLTAAVAAMTLATGTEARAAFGVFSYNAAVVARAGGTADLPGGTSDLVFTANAGVGIDGTIPDGADIIIGRIDFAPGATPTTFTPYSVDFEYNVNLTDVDSGDVGVLNVTGTITGTYVGGATPAINSEIISYSVTPTSLDLGAPIYLVETAPSAGPGSDLDMGVLKLNVRAVPEPGSMALVGVGLVGLMGLRWRRQLQGA